MLLLLHDATVHFMMHMKAYTYLILLCVTTGVLCVHAVLVGAGVGQESGNALCKQLSVVMQYIVLER